MKQNTTYRSRWQTVAALMALMLMTACSQDEIIPTAEVRIPIRLTARLGEVTRSANDSQNDFFDENTFMTIYPYKSTSPYTTADPVLGSAFANPGIDYHTHTAVNKTNVLVSNMADPAYPSSGNATLVGVHPVIGSTTFTGSHPNHTFTIKSDQSAPADYKVSDLMVATRSSAKTDDAINLPFYHKLAKVSVTFHSAAGTPNISKVEVLGIQPSVSVNVNTAAVGTATGAAINVALYNNVTGTNATTTVSAVVPAQPQKASGTAFLRFTFAGGGTITWSLDASLTLTAGNHYQYELQVGLLNIGTIQTTITDWQADGSDETSQQHTVYV